ncbi:MAG: hypothetical protein KGL39_46830 [Patescibacteria group bacterium]|nr:hypothetical protein [Patescibacteria group bacterium]
MLAKCKPAWQWMDKRLRRLFALAVIGAIVYLWARAERGDWGMVNLALAAMFFGAVLACALLITGFLLGVAVLDRLQRGEKIVGAIADAAKAGTIAAQVIRGEDTEEVPQPQSMDEDAEYNANMAALTPAIREQAARMIKRMQGAEEADE